MYTAVSRMLLLRSIPKRHGLMVVHQEEISYRQGWISDEYVHKLVTSLKNTYGQYLEKIPNKNPN